MTAISDTKKMFKILERVVHKLIKHSNDEWKNELSVTLTKKRLNQGTRNRYKNLIKVRPPIRPEDFDSEIKKATDYEITPERFLYLPPMSKESGFIPILSLRCWLLKDPPEISLRLGFFGGLDKLGISELGIGFRFETRHNDGEHNFDHMQLCIGPFDDNKFNKESLKCPIWLPMSWPAVVMPCKNPISMLLSMLVSLYGKEILREFRGINYEKYVKALTYVLGTS